MSSPNRDPEHLAKLRRYYAETRRIPSLARIGELMGFSTPAAKKFVERLAGEGFVTRTTDDDAWIPASRFFERPLVETSVQAGNPIPVEAVPAEPFLIDEYVVRDPTHTVLIPVKGDSMSNAGINEGDMAVVERAAEARDGDFVVAIVDGDYTLKELATERGQKVLKPHNPAYPVIRPKGKLEIFGILSVSSDVIGTDHGLRNPYAPWPACRTRWPGVSRSWGNPCARLPFAGTSGAGRVSFTCNRLR
jgi:SOS-response transcriptional repressor LexA